MLSGLILTHVYKRVAERVCYHQRSLTNAQLSSSTASRTSEQRVKAAARDSDPFLPLFLPSERSTKNTGSVLFFRPTPCCERDARNFRPRRLAAFLWHRPRRVVVHTVAQLVRPMPRIHAYKYCGFRELRDPVQCTGAAMYHVYASTAPEVMTHGTRAFTWRE